MNQASELDDYVRQSELSQTQITTQSTSTSNAYEFHSEDNPNEKFGTGIYNRTIGLLESDPFTSWVLKQDSRRSEYRKSPPNPLCTFIRGAGLSRSHAITG